MTPGTTATRATLSRLAPGYTYCFSARAHDNAGNTSRRGPRQASAPSPRRPIVGQIRRMGPRYRKWLLPRHHHHLARSPFTRSRVQAKRIYLVATGCRTCGTVGVYWNGT